MGFYYRVLGGIHGSLTDDLQEQNTSIAFCFKLRKTVQKRHAMFKTHSGSKANEVGDHEIVCNLF